MKDVLECKSLLLLVEGKDEINFFRALLAERLGIGNIQLSSGNDPDALDVRLRHGNIVVRIEQSGGKTKFSTLFGELKNRTGFESGWGRSRDIGI